MTEKEEVQAYWNAIKKNQDQQETTRKRLTGLDEKEEETDAFTRRLQDFMQELADSWRGEKEDRDPTAYRELYALEAELGDTRRRSHAAIEQERERLERIRRRQEWEEEKITEDYKRKLDEQSE